MPGAETGDVFSLNSALDVLREMGFFDVVLPFLLIFSIVYGTLESVKIFKKKNINAVIAFSLAFLAIGSGYFTGTLKAFTPFVGTLLFFLLSFLVVIGLVAGEELENMIKETWFKIPIILISAGVLIYSFGMTQNWWTGAEGEASQILNSAFLPLFILSGVFIALIFVVVGFEEEG